MMRSFRFCVLLLLVGTATLFFLTKTITPTLPETIFDLGKKDSTLSTATSRKLKDADYNNRSENDELNLEDYGPNDPVPSSKAIIHHRPIQHDIPLQPEFAFLHRSFLVLLDGLTLDGAVETSFEDVQNILDIGGAMGLAGDSVEKIPKISCFLKKSTAWN